MQPLVLCPTQYEASRVKAVARARGAVLQVIGVGCGCEAAIRSVAAAHAGERWVFLVGIAGALRTQARVGEAFLCERVVDEQGLTHLPRPLAHATRLALTCSRDIVVGETSRNAVAERTGAAMVDMESGPFARVAQEMGWRWNVIRGISDDAAKELPAEVMRWLRLDGGTNWRNLAVDLACKPRLWPQVQSMVRHSNAAMRSAAGLLDRTLLELHA